MSRAELDQPTFPPGRFQEREISDLYGFDSANGVWRRVAVTPTGALVVSGGGGGGGVGITDTDDNSIASGQTTLLAIDLNYVFNGTNWIRLQGGVDNAVAPASPQGAFVAGVVTDPVDAFVDGDISLLHMDASGRLLTSCSPGAPGTTIVAGANTTVGVGATVALPVPPPGTISMTVQNRTTGAATRVLVRQVGGAPGTGIELQTRGTITFDKAIAPLEVENIAGPAATIAILFEGL
jgi:hypothetical protein